MTLAGILGSLGGHLNLWIGITFFTFVEIVELTYHCALIVWRSKRRIQHRDNNNHDAST